MADEYKKNCPALKNAGQFFRKSYKELTFDIRIRFSGYKEKY